MELFRVQVQAHSQARSTPWWTDQSPLLTDDGESNF
jgi:hypothetical protein